MGIIDYDLKMKRSMSSIKRSAVYALIGIAVYLFVPMGNLWKSLLWIYIFYQMFTIISQLIDYHFFSKMKRKENEKWGSNFEHSYSKYKKNKSKYDQYSSSSNFNDETSQDWFEFYNRKSDERRKKMYDEYERLKEEYRKKQEEYRRKQQEYYNQRYNYYNSSNNQYKSRSNGSGSGSGITSKSEKISNAFQLLKLSPSDNEKTIKARYRELAVKWHPDKWVTDTKENQKIAERNFQKLSAAYELIKDYKNIK